MVLIGLVPEMFTFGLIGVVFSHSWTFAPAMIHLIYNGLLAWTAHRCDIEQGLAPDCATLLYDLFVPQAVGVWLGTFVGAAFVWAFDWPRLVDFRIFFASPARSKRLFGSVTIAPNNSAGGGDIGTPHNAKPYLWTQLFIGGAIALFVAVLFYNNLFTLTCTGGPFLSVATQNVVGTIALAAALVWWLIYFGALLYSELGDTESSWSRLPDGHRRSGILNFKYIFFSAALFSLPAIYDFVPLTPFARWGLQVGVGLAVLLAMFLAGAHLGESWSGDRYLGTIGAWRIAGGLFLFWLIYASSYLAAPFTDSGFTFGGTPPNAQNAMLWTILFGSIWLVLLVAAGFVTRADPERLQIGEKGTNHYRDAHLRQQQSSKSTSKAVDVGSGALRRRRSSVKDKSKEEDWTF